MKRALLLILLLAVFSPGLIQSQGNRKPDEIQATLQDLADSIAALELRLDDSLAAKADTTVTNSISALIAIIQAGIDSLQAAADTSGGGGGNSIEVLPAAQTSLQALFNRNAKQIVGLADMANIHDSTVAGVGMGGVDLVNIETDTVAWQTTASGASEGSHINFSPPLDLAHFAGGDTAVAADYVTLSLYVADTMLARVSSQFYLQLVTDAFPTYTNRQQYDLLVGAVSAGWNRIKIAKSAFVGAGNWGSIAWITTKIDGTTGGDVVWTTDNWQLIRNTGSKPQPFVGTADTNWTATSTAALTIYQGGPADALYGVQSMVNTDYLTSVHAPGDSMYARVIPAQTDSSRILTLGGDSVRVVARGGNKILAFSAGGVGDSVSYNYAAKDMLTASLINDGSNAWRVRVRRGGDADSILTITTVTTFTTARIRLYGNDRLLDLPALAGLTLRTLIGNLYFYFQADSSAAQ